MKLAVVSPRYGRDVAGGAENAARLLASQLAARSDWAVEALTTCARDATTWADAYPAGAEAIDGVTVHRFPVEGTRAPDFDAATDLIVRRGRGATDDEVRAWVAKQGPVSPQLLDAIRATDADVVAFHPYLYHPTVAGVPAVASRAVLHPAAHDEPMLAFPLYASIFGAARGLAYWSATEQELVDRRFRVGATPSVVVGLGVEPGVPGTTGLDDRPFLLCLGRVDDGKGARLLAECFARYKERRPGDLRLVFAGPVVHPVRDHRDIVVLGPVDEATKWALLRDALVLVSPSAFESFSIVVLEAWSAGTPVMVNARCPVTVDHARRAGGGMAFGSYPEFEVEVDRLVESAELRCALGAAGRAYVEHNYQWPGVVTRYASFLEKIASS